MNNHLRQLGARFLAFVRLDARVPVGRIEKLLVYSLIVFSISFPITHGLPYSFGETYRNLYTTGILKPYFHQIEKLNYYYNQMAFFSGMSNRWTMFATLHRSLFLYVFKAKLTTGEVVLLPTENQDSSRPWYLRYLVDYKIAKFHLNLYPNEYARRRYGEYLCRRFKGHFPNEVQTVLIEHTSRGFLPRERALEAGTHFEPDVQLWKTEEVPCGQATS